MDDDDLARKPSNLTPECVEMLENAVDYIAADAPEQAEIMYRQFSKTRKLIESMPGIGTKYKDGIRKTGLGKFRRYNVYYREKEKNIEIVGIWHTSRGAGFMESEQQG